MLGLNIFYFKDFFKAEIAQELALIVPKLLLFSKVLCLERSLGVPDPKLKLVLELLSKCFFKACLDFLLGSKKIVRVR